MTGAVGMVVSFLARALIEATAVDAVAADFKSAAGADKTAADRWRWYAILFMLTGIGVVTWLLIVAPRGPIDLVDVGRATLVAAALAAPALYAQRESNKHRAAGRQNERFALELNALQPFLANFEDEVLEKTIKKDFADRVFGARENAELIEELEVTQSGLVELLKLLAKKI